MENSLYNLALGFQENGVEVHVYSGYLSGCQESIDGISIFRSTLLPASLPRGDETVRNCVEARKLAIAEEILRFIVDRKIDQLYVCDPLWGIVQTTGAWHHIKQPMTLSLAFSIPLSYREAASIPYLLYTAVSESLKVQILTLSISPTSKWFPTLLTLSTSMWINANRRIWSPTQWYSAIPDFTWRKV